MSNSLIIYFVRVSCLPPTTIHPCRLRLSADGWYSLMEDLNGAPDLSTIMAGHVGDGSRGSEALEGVLREKHLWLGETTLTCQRPASVTSYRVPWVGPWPHLQNVGFVLSSKLSKVSMAEMLCLTWAWSSCDYCL